MDEVSAIQWLLECGEPWTRYRTLLDLLDRAEEDAEVQAARREMLAHPMIRILMAKAATWPGYALKRHNDARHPLYAFSALADFGLRSDDPGMEAGINAVLARASPKGPFQILILLPKVFGGSGLEEWSWMHCDASAILYALLAMGLAEDKRVSRAMEYWVGLAEENGWRCGAAPEFGGKFKGPGKRSDPCPMVNVHSLRAISQVPGLVESPAARRGVEALLRHWELQGERKFFLFGIGTDFRKIKYPFAWYDILHFADALSRFPFVKEDRRFAAVAEEIRSQAEGDGRYTATSMYRAWKGWSFADKKAPSPWLTFLALRILRRAGGGIGGQ